MSGMIGSLKLVLVEFKSNKALIRISTPRKILMDKRYVSI